MRMGWGGFSCLNWNLDELSLVIISFQILSTAPLILGPQLLFRPGYALDILDQMIGLG